MAIYSDHVAAASEPDNRRHKAIVWTGTGVAVVAGLIIGTVAMRSVPRNPPGAPPSTAAPAAASYPRIPGDYQPLNEQQIATAFADGRRVYAAEGLSGLANASMKCFDRLAREPSYGLMDYCLAMDVYGAETYSAVAGDNAPSSTWFGQGPVRRMAAVQALTAGATDANARMLDTSRAIQAVASAATPPPPPMAAATAPPPAAPAAPVAAPAPAPAAVAVAPTPTAPIKPAQPPAPKPTALAARDLPDARPLPPPLRSAPPPMPRAEAPRSFRGPSFDCRQARSTAQQMICGEPELAAADRRLAAAYERAMAETPNPRALQRQQQRWLAARESAGGDYDAVLDLYEIRTRELREEP